jgi:GTPase SAR1 family protein
MSDKVDINDLLLQGSDDKQQEPKERKEEALDAHFYTDALSENEVNNIIVDQRPELITMLGLNGVGKTTFIGSLYHILRSDGELGDYDFFDSDTLAGFEKKIFLRKANKEGVSKTQRTFVNENQFLTLYLQNKNNKKKHCIVLSDKAGELYRSYISDVSKLQNENTLLYSDKILIFINSSLLIGTKYITMYDDLKSLYKRLNDNSLLPINAKKYIIFNQYDKVTDQVGNKIFKDHKKETTSLVEEAFGEKNIKEFCINSKKIDGEELTKLFIELLSPIDTTVNIEGLDWVKEGLKNAR